MRSALARTFLAAFTVLGVHASAASAARPVEGYRSPDNKVGCVLYQNFNSAGNAVKCGRRGSNKGLLLPYAGAARKMAWSWPASRLGTLFFKASWNKTLYLDGGTARLDGGPSILRCTFKKPAEVRCTNGGGYGIIVNKTTLRAVTPIR
jgi:hypothetical protein